MIPPSLRSIITHEYDHYFSAWCPFHQWRSKQPSLMIYKDEYFQCLSCGENGNVSRVEAKIKGEKVPKQAARKHQPSAHLPTHAQLAGTGELHELISLAHDVLISHPGLGWDIEKRGVTGRIIPNMLGWYNSWITVPVTNRLGVSIGIMLRATASLQRSSGIRFSQPLGQKPMLYVPDWSALDDTDFIFVVFGIFDALTLAELGYPVVAGTGGVNQFNIEWLSSYRKMIVLIPDYNEEISMAPYLAALGWRGEMLRLKYPHGAKDPNGFLEVGKKALLQKQLNAYLKG